MEKAVGEMSEPVVIGYIEDLISIREVLPRFVRRHMRNVSFDLLEGVTLQWAEKVPGVMTKDAVARIIRLLPAAETCLFATPGGWAITDSPDPFLASVDREEWWLGGVALVLCDSHYSVLFPGSDGAFLHILTTAGSTFRAAISDEIAGIDWQ